MLAHGEAIKQDEGFIISARDADQFWPHVSAVLGTYIVIDGALMAADAVVKVILRTSCYGRM